MAAFLGALASLGSLNIPYKIEAVQSEWPACSPSHTPTGALDRPGRGCAWEAVSQLPPPPQDALVLCASCHPWGGVSCHPELGGLFWGFPPGMLSLP